MIKDTLAVIGGIATTLLAIWVFITIATWIHDITRHLDKDTVIDGYEWNKMNWRITDLECARQLSRAEVSRVMYDGLENRIKALENKPIEKFPVFTFPTNEMRHGYDYLTTVPTNH